MSDNIFMLLGWAAGIMFYIAAIPFLPRKEVRTPLHALGFAIAFGAMWPLHLIFLSPYAFRLYWLKWVEYREFLIATKAESLQTEVKRKWDVDMIEKFPEAYRRDKEWLDSELSRLDAKVKKMFSRKRKLEDKLRP